TGRHAAIGRGIGRRAGIGCGSATEATAPTAAGAGRTVGEVDVIDLHAVVAEAGGEVVQRLLDRVAVEASPAPAAERDSLEHAAARVLRRPEGVRLAVDA